ncbi:hypothetical protein AKJ50_02125 [candidate division MSBL1 archaeon SCGC-AAA382A13]|uniref:BFN domain-containing protein n=2 Tax=candidate division MSBL1 TaxID=215777 RepID=A0A133VFM9_9EURY|nr:hypothetical protein AKJ50_02125 [candidate division MSBL1 archaeon SCGC-AAA382A13]KXB05258.1 hypothetical protein AKJ49_01155 [candidate division MSBL1 archaeon SCGC-AAA382A03]
MESVKVQVKGVYGTNQGFAIILEEMEGEEFLPVFISKGQAFSIEAGVSGKQAPRPLTHDLILKIISDMDLEIESVTIDDLMDGTFMAELRLVRGERIFPYDVRPSDGIALAVRNNSDIFISKDVMDRAGRKKEELSDSGFEK